MQKFERLQDTSVIKQQVVTQNPKKYEFTTQPTIKPACAGCGLVSTIKPIPGQPFPFQTPAFKKPVASQQDIGSVENGQNFGPQQQLDHQRPPQLSQSFVPENKKNPVENVETINGNDEVNNVPIGPVHSNNNFALSAYPATSPLNGQTHGNIPGVPNVNLLPPGLPTGPLPGNKGINYPLDDQITQNQPNIPIGPGHLPPDVELLPPGSIANGQLPGIQNIPNNQQQNAQYQQNGNQNNVPSSGPTQLVQGPDLGKKFLFYYKACNN